MIAVYCAKAAEAAAVSPVVLNLLSALFGGLLAVGGNLLVQRYVASRAEKSDAVKRKSEFVVRFLLQDIIAYLDSEMLYLQALSLSSGNYPEGVDSTYRWKLGSVKTSIEIIGGQVLLDKLDELLKFRITMENINSQYAANNTCIQGDKAKELEKALKCASDIKSSLWLKS